MPFSFLIDKMRLISSYWVKRKLSKDFRVNETGVFEGIGKEKPKNK
jgi:hypothetical protein